MNLRTARSSDSWSTSHCSLQLTVVSRSSLALKMKATEFACSAHTDAARPLRTEAGAESGAVFGGDEDSWTSVPAMAESGAGLEVSADWPGDGLPEFLAALLVFTAQSLVFAKSRCSI